jgi:hypothetical protein
MKTTLFTLATLVTATLGALADEAPKNEARMLGTLLEATQNNDLQKFESVCDGTMKTAMTEEKLTQVSGQISPLMKDGYKKDYMGVLNRGAVKTYYWKIDFEREGVPEMLAELSIKDGEVAGFFIR